MGLYGTVSEINGDSCRKSLNFPSYMLRPRWSGFPWNFTSVPGVKKISPVGDWRSTSLEWPDLDLGSGHTAYRRASVIDLYLHSKFHWNRRNFLWTDGRTDVRTFSPSNIIRSTFGSRPKNESDGAIGPKITFDDIFSRVDTIHQCDSRMDGRTDGHRATAKTALMHSVAR